MSTLEQILLTIISVIITLAVSLYFYVKEKNKREKINDAFKLSLLQSFESFNQIVELSDQIESLSPVSQSISECASNDVTNAYHAYEIYFGSTPRRHSLTNIREEWESEE